MIRWITATSTRASLAVIAFNGLVYSIARADWGTGWPEFANGAIVGALAVLPYFLGRYIGEREKGKVV